MVIKLTEHDKQDLYHDYPDLNCSLQRGIIWGTLVFSCSYDETTREIIHSNSFENYIRDSYEIRVEFNQQDTFGFPKVYEESGFILAFAIEHGIDLTDLHVNTSDPGSCCLGIFPEYQWEGASPFIRDKIIPYFYWQSFRRIYGKEPWKGYSHGPDGIKEAMSLPPNQCNKGSVRNDPCPCGSGLKYKKCCRDRDATLQSKLQE